MIIINELSLDIDNDNDNDKILAALASCRLASHVLCSFATPPFISSTDTFYKGSDGYVSLFDTSDKVERYPDQSQHRSFNTQLVVLSNCQRFLKRRYHVYHPAPSSTYSEFFLGCRLLRILSFACKGFRSGHSSLVQISKSYDIVPGRYSTFSFYDSQCMPRKSAF